MYTKNFDYALDVEDVHKKFGHLEVLKGVSLKARQGDVISLIGASGSGKSTFLRCINFLEIAEHGRFCINGEEVLMKRSSKGGTCPANWKQVQRLRSGLGMVFQNFNLWAHLTVIENVIEAPVHVLKMSRKDAIAKAEELLAKVGLYDKRNAFPAFLSGGQQQRAAIARALCIEPSAMLFDEPTSALDPELVGDVLRVIRVLAEEGRTMLLVTHEMAFARDVSDYVLYLHNGKVEEEGPPAQIFGDPKTVRCRDFTRLQSH